MKKAILYQKIENKKVQCVVCAHRCFILNAGRGVCGVRENRDGVLYSLVYGKLIAEHIDPIEKKPLLHFLSGTLTYSIAAVGCNFKCLNCQNANISQFPVMDNEQCSMNNEQIPGKDVQPREVVFAAIQNDCPSISYTYTEPTIFVEFALETMKLARQKGLKNVWVSNGYFTEETFKLIESYLDAINVDLKFFREEAYLKICGARLAPVLETIKRLTRSGIHQEITTLIIPGLNDSHAELTDIARFIVSLDKNIPWHISAFHPAFKLTYKSPTSRMTLEKARTIGLEAGLKHVYLGNV